MTLNDLFKLFGLLCTVSGFALCTAGGAWGMSILLGIVSVGGTVMIIDTWGTP